MIDSDDGDMLWMVCELYWYASFIMQPPFENARLKPTFSEGSGSVTINSTALTMYRHCNLDIYKVNLALLIQKEVKVVEPYQFC